MRVRTGGEGQGTDRNGRGGMRMASIDYDRAMRIVVVMVWRGRSCNNFGIGYDLVVLWWRRSVVDVVVVD